jgi:PAS domain S-box-containing protein
MKVLIIDDEGTDRQLLRIALKSPMDEFTFADADCAEDGLKLCKEWTPDCVLLDFHLPDMDGLEVLESLTGGSGRLRCPVVMLTAFGDELLAVRAMKAGAMDYLSKDQISTQNLGQIVRHATLRFRLSEQVEQQRAALEESWWRYQSLLEAIPHMVWVADADGRIEYANTRWFEYTGLNVGVTGLGWEDLIHPDDHEATQRAWSMAAQSASGFEFEHRVRRAADGSYRWHLSRAVLMRTASGTADWFGTYTDIEDQRHAEKTRREREKLESIGRLAAGIAHDFNNLLVGVLGGADCAMNTLPMSHPARGMLETVVQSGQRAAELTRRMLAYAGKGNIFPEPTDLNRIVEGVYENIRCSVPDNIQFEFQMARALPKVRTDVRHLSQTVTDVLRNAVEAVGAGAPGAISVVTAITEVDTRTSRQPEFVQAEIAPGIYVVLEVRDSGCGMDEATRRRAFDPFFSTKSLGRGLGLAAVHGFVRSSGGGIQIVSEAGMGTMLRVLLPAMSAKKPGPDEDAARSVGGMFLCKSE